MNVLLATSPGLFGDTLAFWLAKLSSQIHLVRCGVGSAQPRYQSADPLLILLDIDNVPASNAKVLIKKFRACAPRAAMVVMASSLNDRFVAQTLKSGADAYLPKASSGIEALALIGEALQYKVPNGRKSASTVKRSTAPIEAATLATGSAKSSQPYGLTGRELDTLQHACSGLSNLQIAKRLGISEGVVKIHLHHAYKKLGVQGRTQAVRIVENLESIRRLHIQRVEDLPSLLDWLLPHMSHERHRKGTVLFSKGALGNALYYVQKGRVRLPEIDVEMVAGDLFGEIGIFAPNHTRTSSAVCESESHLFRLTAEQARLLCFENPQFAYFVIRLIADRLVGERSHSD